MIKFLIGGSPCTHWSIAQNKNRETEAEGIGWELFKNYLIAREKFAPDFFLYENNKSAAQAIKDQISLELGEPLQYINSALVSAQNRLRFYVHNFGELPQPADRGIMLRDVLESGEGWKEKAYALTASAHGATPEDALKSHSRNMVAEPFCVAQRGRYTGAGGRVQQNFEPRTDGKTNTLTTVEKDNMVAWPVADKEGKPVRIGNIEGGAQDKRKDSRPHRVYSPEGKTVTLQGEAGGAGAITGLYACPIEADAQRNPIYHVAGGLIEIKGQLYPIKLPDGFYIIRKLTVTECCRLQTLPDDYCRAVSATQAYRGLGNGWTAEVIMHLLSHALKGIPKNEKIVVLSMYDGIGTGRYCFDKLGYKNVTYYAYEIDKYAMQISASNYGDIIQCGDAFAVREDNWFLSEPQALGKAVAL